MVALLTVFWAIKALSYTITLIDSESNLSNNISFPESNVKILKTWDNLEGIIEFPDLIIVLSSSSLTLSQIVLFASQHQIPTIVNRAGLNQPWIFFMWPSENCLKTNLLAAFSYFQVTKPGIIFSFSEERVDLVLEIYEASQGRLSNLLPEKSQNEISIMIGKFFKANGIKEYFVEASGQACDLVEAAFAGLKMLKKWNLVLFSEKCAHRIGKNGSLAIVYSGLENVISDYEYSSRLILEYYSKIQGKNFDNYQIKSEFEAVTKLCKHSIINLINDKKKVVAYIEDGKVELIDTVIYFEGDTQRTIVSRPPIQFSAYTGVKNPPGQLDVIQNGKYQKGNYYAIAKINKDNSLLENFELQIFDQVECGVTVFDYNFSKSCFLNISNELGVAYIPSFYASSLIPLIEQWKEIGLTTPMVSGIGGSSVLSNSTKYPNFTRMVSSLDYVIKLLGKFTSIMGWEKLVVFYTDENFGRSVYDIVLEDSKSGSFKIMNDDKYRKVEYSLGSYELDKYKENIKNAVETGCNIFVLCMSDPAPYFWMEVLYDYGIRRGDITIIITTITGPDAISFANGNNTKREELLFGSLSLYNAGWMGVHGEKIQEEVNKLYNYSWMSSFYIDATYSIAHSLDLAIREGKDFEDPGVFMTAQRQTRFTGASGLVSLEPNTNDRSLNFFHVYNIYKVEKTGKWTGQAVALISPLSSVYYTVISPFVWSSGKKPSDVKMKFKNCEMVTDVIRASPESEFLEIVIILSVLGCSLLITLIIARIRKLNRINMLQVNADVTLSDYITIISVLIEPFQLIALAPSASYNKFIEALARIFTLNCVTIFKVRDATYWSIFTAYLAFGYIWIILVIIGSTFLLNLFGKYKISIIRFKDFMVPIMADYLFLPLILSVLTILSCHNAVSSDIFDSIFDYDCSLYCWNNTHLATVVLASFFIIAYTPLALYNKSNLQNKSSSINIKTNEYYNILKTVIILMIVAFKKFLISLQNNLFSFYYIFLILVLFCYVMKNNTYNYDRCNLWNKVTLLTVMWNVTVIISSQYLLLENYFFVCIQLLGFACILILGMKKHIKLPPSLIVMSRGRTVVDMFKYQFGMRGFEKTLRLPDRKTYDYSSTIRVENI